MQVRAWWWSLPFAAVVLMGVYLLRSYDPNAPGNPFLACSFYKLTGWHCPGCGLTRALHALVYFDLPRAIRMNALFMLSSPIWALMIYRCFKPLPSMLERYVKPFLNPWLWLIIVPAFGVMRNFPWHPFTWLAPM
jgi:Protein of unknown function (DUF2752)